MLPGRMTARRLLAALALAALLTGAAGCNKSSHVTVAKTEGVYVNVGPLDYQVQISRLLNPADLEDQGYLKGLTPAEAQLGPKQAWFGIFLRVENNGRHAAPSARDIEIRDTQDARYDPVALLPSNVFAYRPTVIQAHAVLPAAETPAAAAPIGGAMVLFKIDLPSLENRPLELHIHDPAAPAREGVIDLDV
jgi:hypothetical protein